MKRTYFSLTILLAMGPIIVSLVDSFPATADEIAVTPNSTIENKQNK